MPGTIVSASVDETTERHVESARIAVIGAGFAGLGMGIRLRQQGIEDFVILERSGDLGGTWRDNQYPGCAVDVQSHLYSYSFAPNPDWSAVYAPQPEIWAYIRRTAEQHRVLPHVRYGREVVQAAWDGAARRWRIETTGGTFQAQFLVSGMGPLSNPIPPDMPNLERFGGVCFHSGRWEHQHDLRGKRIGVVGTGSSATQFIPEIQPQAGRLVIFQRTPGWVVPRFNRRITRPERLLYRRLPALQRLARERQYLYRELIAFNWQRNGRSRWLEALLKLRIRQQVKDPGLRRKLIPSYPVGCKRLVVSDDYLPALTRSNVDLVTERIMEVTPGGLRTEDGREHELDVLILATGFEVMPVADPLIGRDGVALRERWSKRRAAYLGTTVAGYPNYFMLGGPNTATGHTSVLLYTEPQIEYTIEAIRTLDRRELSSIEVRQEVQDAFNAEIQARLRQTVWVAGGCRSWYLDADGGSSALWPGYTSEFRRRLARFQPSDFTLR